MRRNANVEIFKRPRGGIVRDTMRRRMTAWRGAAGEDAIVYSLRCDEIKENLRDYIRTTEEGRILYVCKERILHTHT